MSRAKQRKSDAVGKPNRIRVVRQAQGLSARQLAAMVTATGYELHYSTLAKIEAGERTLHDELLSKLAEVLHVERSELLDRFDRPKIQNVPVYGIGSLAAALMTDDVEGDFHVPVYGAGRLVAVRDYDPAGHWVPFLRGTVVIDLDDRRSTPEEFDEDDQASLQNAIFLAVLEGGNLMFVRRLDESRWGDGGGRPVSVIRLIGRAIQDIVRLRNDLSANDRFADRREGDAQIDAFMAGVKRSQAKRPS